MTPLDCSTMAELREQIDRLDAVLVALLAERSRFIDRAAEIKRPLRLPARITPRVEEVVAHVRSIADENRLDADLVETLWRTLIEWSIAREEGALAHIAADKSITADR